MSNQNPLVNSEEPNDKNKTNNVPTTPKTPPPPPPTYPTGLRQNLTLLATSLSIFLVSLDSTLLSTTIPSILNSFHHLSHTTWYTTSYMLGMATTQAFWGKAYSCWPLKSTFLISSIIFSAGAGICAMAPNSEVFILGRVVGGFGGAGVAAGTFLIVACTAPVEKRPVRLGVVSLWFVVAAVVGPLAGGVLATKVSWRAGFYVGLPIGGISLVLIFFFFETPAHARPAPSSFRDKLLQLDFAGMLLTIAFGACLVLALQWAGITKSWKSSPVIGCLLSAGLALSLLISVEVFLGELAGLSSRLIRHNKTIALQLLFNITVSGTYYLMLYYLPLFFQIIQGVNAAQSGLRILALVGTSAPVAILSGLILSHTQDYQLIMLLSAIFSTIGSSLIFFTLGPQSSMLQTIGYQIFVGIGLGLSIQLSIIVCQNVVAAADLTRANTWALWIQLLGGVVVLAVAQSAVSNRLLAVLPEFAPQVSSAVVLEAGPGNFRAELEAAQIGGVVRAYMSGLKIAFGIALALSCASVVVALLVLAVDRRKLGDGRLGDAEKLQVESASEETVA